MNELERRAKRSREACQVIQNPTAAYDEIARLQSEVERLRGWCEKAETRIETLRQKLPVIKNEWFYRGAASTLSMLDLKSTEYHDCVLQHGGYEMLMEHAEEYDRYHLVKAAEYHLGEDYAQRLRQQAAESENE